MSAPSTTPAPPARPAGGRRSGQRFVLKTRGRQLPLAYAICASQAGRPQQRAGPGSARDRGVERALRVPASRNRRGSWRAARRSKYRAAWKERRAYRIRRRSSGEEADYRDGDSPVTLRASARVAPAVRDREQRESSRAAMIAPGFHAHHASPPTSTRIAVCAGLPSSEPQDQHHTWLPGMCCSGLRPRCSPRSPDRAVTTRAARAPAGWRVSGALIGARIGAIGVR